MNNKVQFNLKNVHYSVLTPATVAGEWPTYSEPVAVPGAVTLTLDPQGSVEKFYADGIVYYQAVANNGYSGDLEVARIPDKMLQDVWKFEVNEDGVILENAELEPSAFALLYQIDGDANNDFYCLYNCSGTRPGVGGTTNTETKTPQTRTSTISAVALTNGKVMARTTGTTKDDVKANWFKEIYIPTATETTPTETTSTETTSAEPE